MPRKNEVLYVANLKLFQMTEVQRDILSVRKGPDTIMMRTTDITKINTK